MALYDSLYSLDQAYSPFTNKMMRPGGKKELFYDQGGGKEFFYNQDDGLGLSSLMGEQPQATQNPNIDSGFYNSPEYQGLPKMGQQNSIQTKYFGQVDGFQGGMDAAYEAYLNKTGQPDQIIPGYAPGMDPSKQENQPRLLPGTGEINPRLGGAFQPQPRPGLGERPAGASDQDWQRYTDAVAEQHQKRLDGDMSRYIGTGEGTHKFQQFIKNNDLGSKLSIASPFLNTRPGDEGALPMPPQQTINTSAGPMLPPMPTPTPMPTSTPMPGDVGYVPYGSSNNQPPTPMPTSTPMPGDVGYVPYGSSNNQPFVQGLAGGGPIRNLSFVELLKQIMEN